MLVIYPVGEHLHYEHEAHKKVLHSLPLFSDVVAFTIFFDQRVGYAARSSSSFLPQRCHDADRMEHYSTPLSQHASSSSRIALVLKGRWQSLWEMRSP